MKIWKIITTIITALMFCMYAIGLIGGTSTLYDHAFKIVFIVTIINLVSFAVAAIIEDIINF